MIYLLSLLPAQLVALLVINVTCTISFYVSYELELIWPWILNYKVFFSIHILIFFNKILLVISWTLKQDLLHVLCTNLVVVKYMILPTNILYNIGSMLDPLASLLNFNPNTICVGANLQLLMLNLLKISFEYLVWLHSLRD